MQTVTQRELLPQEWNDKLRGVIRQVEGVLTMIPYSDSSEKNITKFLSEWIGDNWFSESITMKIEKFLEGIIENYCGLQMCINKGSCITYRTFNKNIPNGRIANKYFPR